MMVFFFLLVSDTEGEGEINNNAATTLRNCR